MLPKTTLQEPGMKKFYSSEYGFFHAMNKDGTLWYNLTDICSALSLRLHEAESMAKNAGCKVREFNVRRQKVTTCNRYVDYDGMMTIIVESRKSFSNAFRVWVAKTVTYSLLHPDETMALDELDESKFKTAYDMRMAYINQAKKRERSQTGGDSVEMVTTPNTPKPTPKKKGTRKPAKRPAPTAAATQPSAPTPPTPPAEKTEKVVPISPALRQIVNRLGMVVSASQISVQDNSSTFTPENGHMTVEEFFRDQMSFPEFLYHLDIIIREVKAFARMLPKEKSKSMKLSIEVVSTFRNMIKANAGQLVYMPQLTNQPIGACL